MDAWTLSNAFFALLTIRDRRWLVLLVGSTVGPDLAGWFNRVPLLIKLVDVARDAKLASKSDPLRQQASWSNTRV